MEVMEYELHDFFFWRGHWKQRITVFYITSFNRVLQKLNAGNNYEALNRPCMRQKAFFESRQKDSVPSHKTVVTQDRMTDNMLDHITPNMLTPKLPYLNFFHQYMWSNVVRESNQHSYNMTDCLKTGVTSVTSNINTDHVTCGCQRFRPRVEHYG